MNDEPRWLSKAALLLLHEESIATFGGARGVRDHGLLDSALARAQNTWAYRPDASLAELAAAYGYGLAKNHAFVDGNKRVAFLAIGVFLEINACRFTASPQDSIQSMLALAAGELSEDALSRWITDNSSSIEESSS